MKARKQTKGGSRKRPSPAVVRSAFEKAHSAWLAAHARAHIDGGTDKKIYAALDDMMNAEWRLIRTPAEGLCHIKQRAAFVQTLMSEAMFSGRRTDNIDQAAFAVLASEIMLFSPDDERAQS